MPVKRVRMRSRSHRGAVRARNPFRITRNVVSEGPRRERGRRWEHCSRSIRRRAASEVSRPGREAQAAPGPGRNPLRMPDKFAYELDRYATASRVRPVPSHRPREPRAHPNDPGDAHARPIVRLGAPGAVPCGAVAEGRPGGRGARAAPSPPVRASGPDSRSGSRTIVTAEPTGMRGTAPVRP